MVYPPAKRKKKSHPLCSESSQTETSIVNFIGRLHLSHVAIEDASQAEVLWQLVRRKHEFNLHNAGSM